MDSKITLLKILVVTTMLVATTEGNCMATCQNICQQSNNPLTIPHSRPGKRGPKGDVGPRGEIGKSCECPDVTALEQTILNITKSLHKLEYNQALLLSSFDFGLPGDGWIVIQKRLDGSVDFYKGWQEYVDGFGNPLGEFWLGLKKIHQLTTTYNMTFRVDLEDRDGNKAYAEYSTFKVASSSDNYRLTIGGYSGTAGHSMTANNNKMFSTFDRDNDEWGDSCAKHYHGAWWYTGDCGYSNLNGDYSAVSRGKAITWYYWKNNFDGLKSTQMSMRRH